MALSTTERWILSNQHRILEALYPEEAGSLAEMREAIECGYEAHYEPDHIYKDTMSAAECEEVMKTLDMFRALKSSHDDLPDKSGIEPKSITFSGFDGNNEGKFMAYARYFCKHDGGRFQELDIKDFNSHFPMRGRYQKMRSKWQAIGGRHEGMTKDHILHIIS